MTDVRVRVCVPVCVRVMQPCLSPLPASLFTF